VRLGCEKPHPEEMAMSGSRGDVQLENEHFRVTKWTIEPGGHIPMHVHEHEYVVVPMVTDAMRVVNADGTELIAELVTGESYTRASGAEHRIENHASSNDIVFVEIEKL